MMPPAAMTALSVEELSVRLPPGAERVLALDRVSLRVDAG